MSAGLCYYLTVCALEGTGVLMVGGEGGWGVIKTSISFHSSERISYFFHYINSFGGSSDAFVVTDL